MPRPLFVRSGHPDHAPRAIYADIDDADDSTDIDNDIDMKRKRDTTAEIAADRSNGRQTNNEIDSTADTAGDKPLPHPNLVLEGGQAIKLLLVNDPKPQRGPTPPKKERKPHPQAKMRKFWKNFDPEFHGKVTRVLPDCINEKDLSPVTLVGEIAHKAIKSYDDAKESCIRDVKRIIKECRAANQKYTDSHWDIERDLKISRIRDCLEGLVTEGDKENPADAKRVTVSTPLIYDLTELVTKTSVGHLRRPKVLYRWGVIR